MHQLSTNLQTEKIRRSRALLFNKEQRHGTHVFDSSRTVRCRSSVSYSFDTLQIYQYQRMRVSIPT